MKIHHLFPYGTMCGERVRLLRSVLWLRSQEPGARSPTSILCSGEMSSDDGDDYVLSVSGSKARVVVPRHKLEIASE
jgi:hypothetical protein